MRSLQEKFPQVSGVRQKLGEGLPNSNSSCHSCDPSLSNGVTKKADVKHKSSIDREADDGPKVDVDKESTGHQPNQHQVKASQNWQQTSYSQQPYRQPKPTVVDSLHQQQQWQRHIVNSGQYQQQAKQGAQLNRQQQAEGGVSQQLDHLSAQLQSVLDFSRLPSLEEALSPSGSPPLPPSPPPLPLFSRCPFTNQAQLWGLQEASRPPSRAPLHPLPLHPRDLYGPSISLRRPWPTASPPSPPAASSKPSLDAILCTSLVALANKHREGKYWFKSGCPTPDPRWPAVQQLMAGPIPGDCDYSELRTAFLSHGQTCHLFIQNNQAWLERNQEKFGSRQVKFGYVVFTEAETAERLFRQGGIVVRRASGERIQVRVKRMDGLPAQFYRS